tara:strand:- start:163 stop:885 length:723 start_codon:yes stop_codon:yes gene_type:complete
MASQENEEDLRAQLAAMKGELEASRLREQLGETQLRAERLENENLLLRQQQQQQQQASSSSSSPKPSIIDPPNINESDVDNAFETMLEECLSAESKRESLRTSYYNKPNASDKYYFFLEWASYLRKPEVMEQNNMSSDIDILPPGETMGDEDGMRQRSSRPASTAGSTAGMDKGLLPKTVPHHQRSSMSGQSSGQPLSWSLQAFFYIVLVSAIAGILWLLKNLFLSSNDNNLKEYDEQWG